MHEVLVNCLGGLSLPRKSVVMLTDGPDMTLDVYRGRKTTMQQHNIAVVKEIQQEEGEPIFLPRLYESTGSYCCQIDIGFGVGITLSSFMSKCFMLCAKTLTGELSCMGTDLVLPNFLSKHDPGEQLRSCCSKF